MLHFIYSVVPPLCVCVCVFVPTYKLLEMRISKVSVYHPPPRNLLGDGPGEKLDIRLSPDGSGQLYVPGLSQVTVQSPEDIHQVGLCWEASPSVTGHMTVLPVPRCLSWVT